MAVAVDGVDSTALSDLRHRHCRELEYEEDLCTARPGQEGQFEIGHGDRLGSAGLGLTLGT
jgi:hypothetical protein